MKRINLPLVFDSFFAALCAFLLFYTAVRFYTKNSLTGLIFGICAFLLFGALAFLYIRKKQNKKLLLARDEKDRKLLELHLSLLPDKDVAAMFVNIIDDGAVQGKHIETDKEIFFFIFCLKQLSPDDIAGVIKFSTGKDKVVYCNEISAEAKELADNFAIKYKTSDKIYLELKDKDALPQKFIFNGGKRPGALKKIKARFNKKLTAPLFWSGLCLLAFSFFTFFPIYYIVTGGILLVLSAVCLVFG